MAAPTIFWAGGEDSDFTGIGTNRGVDTTAGHFRSTYARCGVSNPNGSAAQGIANIDFWSVHNEFSTSAFWFTAQLYAAGGTIIAAGEQMIRFTDSAGVVRIRLRVSTANTTVPTIGYTAETVNAAGAVVTTIGTYSLIQANASLGKIDIFCNYASSGQFTIYNNGTQILTFSGNLLTDSNTTINGFDLGTFQNFTAAGGPCCWSELIVSDSDTRQNSLQTLAPVANGSTHNFDTGTPAASNVNETTMNDATLDGSTTAGQIDQYTIPALASGNPSILAVVVSARMQEGSSGPAHADVGVRAGSTPGNYWSSNFALTTAWGPFQNVWLTDPSTGTGWQALPVNIGVQSVT